MELQQDLNIVNVPDTENRIIPNVRDTLKLNQRNVIKEIVVIGNGQTGLHVLKLAVMELQQDLNTVNVPDTENQKILNVKVILKLNPKIVTKEIVVIGNTEIGLPALKLAEMELKQDRNIVTVPDTENRIVLNVRDTPKLIPKLAMKEIVVLGSGVLGLLARKPAEPEHLLDLNIVNAVTEKQIILNVPVMLKLKTNLAIMELARDIIINQE